MAADGVLMGKRVIPGGCNAASRSRARSEDRWGREAGWVENCHAVLSVSSFFCSMLGFMFLLYFVSPVLGLL